MRGRRVLNEEFWERKLEKKKAGNDDGDERIRPKRLMVRRFSYS
jgi:hypothetical protein